MVALATRLAVLPASHPGNMSPDAAHFLTVARCVSRGEGFSNPAAWPAWLEPRRLPAPETFKDPGFPYGLAALAPLTGDLFLAGQRLSLAAGLMLPLVVLALARRLTGDRAVALLAALLAAASPVLVAQSVRVMSESLFTLLLTLSFLSAAPPASTRDGAGGTPVRGKRREFAAGALLGLAFLVRGQALLAVPAAVLLLATGRPAATAVAGLARAGIALLTVASPLLIRNLTLFGTPLHSDAVTFAVWPFVDPIDFSHRLTRPPAPGPFLLQHLPEVATHTLASLARFVRGTLPRDILGHAIWAPALATGVVIGLTRRRTWGFAWAYLVPVVVMMSMVSWNTRYFASTAPLWCLLAALGALWLARRTAIAWPLAVRVLAVAALLGLFALQTRRAWRELDGYVPPELAAAAAEAPNLAARLAPGEAVMAVTTSYWSWFADRPSVHLVIADEGSFRAVIRRYRVRWAALPTSRLAELAARYPGGRLPAALVLDHLDPEHDLTVFAVRDSAAAPGR